MDDGKPVKAKWWSRPRHRVPAPDATAASDGAPPAASGTPPSTNVPDHSDGDYELDRPIGANQQAPGAAGDLAPDAAQEQAASADGAPTPAVEQAKPLHDPDLYSTPPYGRPGPWAPAPPVQHPGVTPAHGVPAPGVPAPGAPADGAPPPAPAAHHPWQNYDPWAVAPFQQNGAPVGNPAVRRRRGKRSAVVGGVLIALLSGGIGGAVGSYMERNGGVGDIQLPQAGVEDTGRAADSVAGIAASALPSVVTLHVKGAEAQGTGTGFVLDRRGHILTNNHVVEPAGSGGRISVTFSGGETARGEVVGRDSGYDLAVVKVSGVRGLKPLPLGNSDNVQVGDPVVAIGAPFDLANTVTSGIISAKERPITAGGEKGDGSDISYVDALQTDAPINPGNSGGPLVDSRARVIGINSAIRSADSGSDLEGQAGSIGLGFAIPINQGKRVAEELINTGRATHPVIGVTLDMNYDGDGARVGAEGQGDDTPVNPVNPGGPGDKAGIKAGDIITEVDGRRIHSGEELIVKTRAHRPGDRLELTLDRDGEQKRITLTLGSADGG